MKLLIVDLHHLGDAVMALPFVRAARRHFEVHLCCRPSVRPVFARVLPPERIGTWDPPWHEESRAANPLAALRSVAEKIGHWREAGFDAAACVWADSRVHGMLALAGIPKRIGFPMNARNFYGAETPWRARRLQRGKVLAVLARAVAFRPLLTDPLQRGSLQQHHMDAWKQISNVLDCGVDTRTPWFDTPPVVPVQLEKQRTLLVHAGARLATKRWPLENFQAVLERLPAVTGWNVRIVSGPDEPCPVAVHPNQKVLHPASVNDLIDLISTVDLVLCNDSFAAHVAAAWGKPMLTIFGSGNPAWFAPGADQNSVIAPAPCPWHPCIDVCQQPRVLCLEDIPVELVEERLALAMSAIA